MRKSSIVLVSVIFGIVCGCAGKFKPANPEAFGTRWELLGVDAKRIQSFFDPESITHSGDITRFKARAVGRLGYEVIGWVELDCARNKLRGVDSVRYDKYHRYLGKLPDEPWIDIKTNSALYQNKQRFCK